MWLGRLEQAIGKVHDARVSEQHIVNDGPIPDGVDLPLLSTCRLVIIVKKSAGGPRGLMCCHSHARNFSAGDLRSAGKFS